MKMYSVPAYSRLNDRSEWGGKVGIQTPPQAGYVYLGEAARQIQIPAALLYFDTEEKGSK